MRISYMLFCCCVLSTGLAQNNQYSLYDFTGQRINPGLISLDDYMEFSGIYRSQRSLSGIEMESYFMEVKYPFIKPNGGDRWSSFGVFMEGDKVGFDGAYTQSKIGISYAFNLDVGNYSQLSVGPQVSYNSRDLNGSGLFTGSQYREDFGFDLNLPNGEIVDDFQANFISAGIGAVWAKEDKKGRVAHFGLSAFDINRPNESFIERQNQLPITTVLQGGLVVYRNRIWDLYPQFMLAQTAGTQLVNAGFSSIMQLDSYDSRLNGQQLEFTVNYLSNQGAALGVIWSKDQFSLGVNYDLPLNNRLANQGAFEIALKIGRLRQSKYKAKRFKRKRSRKSNPRTVRSDSTSTKPMVLKEQEQEFEQSTDDVLVEQVSEEPNTHDAEVGKFEFPEFNKPIHVNFEFAFNSSSLSANDKKELDDLVKLMEQDPTIKVAIRGHTDDVGSEEYNLKLSKQRALSVADYLIESGIHPKRIRHNGYGESRPLVENNTEANRQKNRRVEFRLYRVKSQKDDH